MRGGGSCGGWSFREGYHLEDADVLPLMKLERLWPVIVHGNPELRTTGERLNAGHKSRESVVGAKKDVLSKPGIVAADKAGCLGGDVCCLEQPSAASCVRVGSARWSRQ